MSDAITRIGDLDKFWSRSPAWHRKGTVLDVEMTASEALTLIGGAPPVRLEELVTLSGTLIEHRAIVRAPVADDFSERVFGIVGPEYTLVTPDDAVKLWDEHVNKPVETLGMLGLYGEEFFLTAKLPTLGVKGEQVDNYLLGHFPMTSYKSAQAIVSPVMVVCQNTLRMAESMAVQRMRAIHDRTVKQQLASWMHDVIARAEQQTATLQEAFDVLAGYHIEDAEVSSVLTATYPTPSEPRTDDLDSNAWRLYEYKLDAAERAREDVRLLFSGAATGADLEARKGTAWGLYGAITERENYRRGGDDGSSAVSILLSTTATSRGATMARAFTALLETARN